MNKNYKENIKNRNEGKSDFQKTKKLDIKELKHEFDLEGVSIRVVCKGIRNIKQAKKTTPEEQAEVSTVQNLLTSDKEFMDIMSNLVAKD